MSKFLFFLCIIFFSAGSFAQDNREIMYRVYDEVNDDCGYLNQGGDTLVPLGECLVCFSDSLNYAIVLKLNDSGSGFLAINSKGNEVFRVFVYDNGPDYIEDGTFRIVKDGLIGYATEDGEIIIPPKYEAAWPFENGRAQVSIKATKERDGEHWFWTNTDWFYIDKNGSHHENQEE